MSNELSIPVDYIEKEVHYNRLTFKTHIQLLGGPGNHACFILQIVPSAHE